MAEYQSMSLGEEVRNDIKAAQKLRLSRWGVLLWMAFCLPVIWICDHFGKLNLALPVLNTIAVLSLVIALRWNLRGQLWFWIAMILIGALHAWLIWYIPWTKNWVPALAIAAIDSTDFCILLWGLSAVGRLMERKTTTNS
jgi:hypothetical protein